MKPAHLASKLGVDKSAVSRWMSGSGRPRMPIEQVAGALGLSTVEFYGADLAMVEAELKRRESNEKPNEVAKAS